MSPVCGDSDIISPCRGQHDQPVAAEDGTGPVDRAGLVLLVAKARQRAQPANLSVLAPQADRLVVAGQHEDEIAADPRPMTAADLLLPGAFAAPQVDRRHAAAMADRVGPAAIDDRAPANIGETGHRVGGPRRGQIVGPDHAAVLGPQPEHLARAVADHDDLLAHGGAGAAEQAGGLGNAVMGPQAAPVIGRQHVERVLDADREDAAIRDGRRSVQRRRDVLAPDHPSIGRIERQNLTVSGRYEQAIVPEARAAAEGAAAFVLRFQIDRPDSSAGGEVEGADLCCPVHRENPVGGDNRR